VADGAGRPTGVSLVPLNIGHAVDVAAASGGRGYVGRVRDAGGVAVEIESADLREIAAALAAYALVPPDLARRFARGDVVCVFAPT